METTFVDHYAVLSVDADATAVQISKAYRKLALKYHPDKNPSEEAKQKFDLVKHAYETLTNEEARNKYDQTWKAKRMQQIKRDQLDANRKRMRDELELREKLAEKRKKESSVDAVSELANDTKMFFSKLRKNREFGSSSSPSSSTLDHNSSSSVPGKTTVVVKWKNGPKCTDVSQSMVLNCLGGEFAVSHVAVSASKRKFVCVCNTSSEDLHPRVSQFSELLQRGLQMKGVSVTVRGVHGSGPPAEPDAEDSSKHGDCTDGDSRETRAAASSYGIGKSSSTPAASTNGGAASTLGGVGRMGATSSSENDILARMRMFAGNK